MLRSFPLDNIQYTNTHTRTPSLFLPSSCSLSSLTHAHSPSHAKSRFCHEHSFQRLPSPITFPKGGREGDGERERERVEDWMLS